MSSNEDSKKEADTGNKQTNNKNDKTVRLVKTRYNSIYKMLYVGLTQTALPVFITQSNSNYFNRC